MFFSVKGKNFLPKLVLRNFFSGIIHFLVVIVKFALQTESFHFWILFSLLALKHSRTPLYPAFPSGFIHVVILLAILHLLVKDRIIIMLVPSSRSTQYLLNWYAVEVLKGKEYRAEKKKTNNVLQPKREI